MNMDGVRIHYQDEGSGAAILLIHGSSESLRAWDGVAARLHDHYRIVRFDVPDNGLSSADPKRRYTVEDDGTRITALMDFLKIPRFAIGGSSWGGTVAYNYAIDHPDRVTALVLISIPGIRQKNAYFNPYAGLSGFDRWVNQYYMPPAQVEASIRSVVANTDFLTPGVIRMYQDLLNQRDRPAEWGAKLAQIIPAEADARAHQDLARVTVPTLIAWGRNNPAYGPGCADDLEKILVKSPLVRKSIYDNVGHKVEREAPALLAADMELFLAAASTAPPH
jgi:pimeloyl-ACP methyl ester carboxylesterase